MFWSKGLLKEMKESSVYEDKEIAVIRDKFPKAKHHFLALPKADIKNLQGLNKSHVPLLQKLESKGLEVAKDLGDKTATFRLGYHAIPSMERLHLHIISDDFIAIGLKTKKHWNSFTTEFFIPSKEIITRLDKEEKITIKQDFYKSQLLQPLQCHKCSFMPRTMPELKDHLNKHITNSQS
ncbi:unnamed protein product [Bemisia tabaci]|uniref:Aprataxin C2HE/C2H2/C2HC zinc finger domain-containing protein n=1 Tax=Bemisia tabaci TaxID=7038 RepID=A0A9P0A0E6_BEMTA|nr:unnamed protein product [Bemisia tabaci]